MSNIGLKSLRVKMLMIFTCQIFMMLKECWNKNLPPSDFATLLFKPSTNTQQVLNDLVEFCGTEYEPSSIFLDYLCEAVNKAPQQTMSTIKNSPELEKRVMLRAISHKMGMFFKNFQLDDDWSVNFTLNFFKSLVDDKNIEFIQQLSCDPHFSALIARANVSFPQEMDEIRELFPVDQFCESIGFSVPYPTSILKKALYMENMTQPVLQGYSEILKIAMPNISAVMGYPSFYHLIDLDLYAHLYLYFIDDYMKNPTLTTAYYITRYFPRMRVYFETGELPPPDDGELHASEIFKTLDLCKNIITRSDYLQNHAKRSDSDLLFSVDDIENIKLFLTTIPDTIDPDKIIELTLQYPAMSISLYSTITKSITMDTFSVFAMYAQQIINIHSDFATFLFQQNLFFDFLNLIIPVVTSITDRFAFYHIYMLFLTLIRDSYGLGWLKLNNEIVDFINRVENPALKYFLTLLVHLNPQEYECPKTAKTPFLESVITIQKLIYDEISIESVNQKLESRPYLAPSLLTFCLANPIEEIKKVFTVKPTDVYLNNLFTYHLMIYCNKQSQPWIAGSILPDYVFMKHESPQKLDSINPILARTFDDIIFTIPLTQRLIWHVVCAWRAWANVFGLPVFVKHLFGQLLWKAKLLNNEQYAESLFRHVAVIMSFAYIEEETFVHDINSIVDYFINEGLIDKIDAQNIAAFVFILITANMKDDSLKAFNNLIQTCVSIVDMNNDPWRLKFALSLLSMSIHNKKLVTKLGMNVELCLQKADEMDLLCDFYIMKHKAGKDKL